MDQNSQDANLPPPELIEEIRRQHRVLKRAQFIALFARPWWTRAVGGLRRIGAQTWEGFTCEPDKVPYHPEYMNKCTFFYYTPDAVEMLGTYPYISNWTGAAVVQNWYRLHDGQPNIDWGRYFGFAFRISNPNPTPWNLSDIVAAHNMICANHVKGHQLALQAQNNGTSSNAEPIDHRNYKCFPLCQALLVVQDSDVTAGGYPNNPNILDFDGVNEDDPDSLPRISLEKYEQIQTVLIIRTGIEEQLKFPISFDSLADKALPVAHADAPLDGQNDVVRVSLIDAIEFITGLQKREETSDPTFYHNPRIDRKLDASLELANSPERNWPDRQYEIPSEDEFVDALFTKGVYKDAQSYLDWAVEAVTKRATGVPDCDLYGGWLRYGGIKLTWPWLPCTS